MIVSRSWRSSCLTASRVPFQSLGVVKFSISAISAPIFISILCGDGGGVGDREL